MRYIYYFLFSLCMFMYSSCNTYTNFTVLTDPGTEIYNTDYQKVAIADNMGKANIKHADKNHATLMLSHKPGTDYYVPFALDYKEKKFNGLRNSILIGSILTVGGLCATGINKEAGIMVSEMGLLTLVGSEFFIPRSSQPNHEYSYKYLPIQHANQDIAITQPVLVSSNAEKKTTTSSTASKTKSQTSSVSRKKINSTASTKTLKDNASSIEGSYVGTGSLKKGNTVVESYSNIKVTVKKKSKDVVLVNVVESNGSKYFETDCEYTINKLSNGKYSLTLNGINSATINIDTKNNMIYVHPRVNIDGEIYSLNISAKKSN